MKVFYTLGELKKALDELENQGLPADTKIYCTGENGLKVMVENDRLLFDVEDFEPSPSEMNVMFYTTSDGDPWGLFVHGHVDKSAALEAINREAEKQGFESISIDSVQHTFGVRDVNSPSDFNFHLVTQSSGAALPITYVDSDELEYKK